jgi:hypothetical protein
MGGTGNTGEDPNKANGLSTSVDGGGAAATPGWAGGAQAPGDVSQPGGVPAPETSPALARDYELTTASTGTGATAPVQNLGFPSAAEPMGFHHAPYPTAAAAVPTYAGAAPAAPAAAAGDGAAKEDPNARVAVYLPGGDYGFGTASGIFGNTSQHTYQQQAGPNGSTQAINNPYGISIEGVASGNDPWRQRAGQELSWLDPASYSQNTTLKESGLQPTAMTYKPGDTVAAGTANVPTMSKALYDWNMKVYGNPYGAGYTQQYIGGPTPTPLQSGGQ